jgi:hypothetical protein
VEVKKKNTSVRETFCVCVSASIDYHCPGPDLPGSAEEFSIKLPDTRHSSSNPSLSA